MPNAACMDWTRKLPRNTLQRHLIFPRTHIIITAAQNYLIYEAKIEYSSPVTSSLHRDTIVVNSFLLMTNKQNPPLWLPINRDVIVWFRINNKYVWTSRSKVNSDNTASGRCMKLQKPHYSPQSNQHLLNDSIPEQEALRERKPPQRIDWGA